MIEELQEWMRNYGYYKGRIDGIVGPLTIRGLSKAKKDLGLKEEQRKIVDRAREEGMTRKQVAYVMATVEHETNNTFKPVKEAYWVSEGWRQKNLRYYPYYGRGYVQITWKRNYEVFGKLLGIDLVSTPDLALQEDIALEILVIGLRKGLFTGWKLEDYINDNETDYYNARRCVNGLDRAQRIADLAIKWER